MKRVLSIILIAAILCLALVGCAKKKPQETTQRPQGGVGLIVDPNQGDEDKQETVKAPNVAIPGWGELTIPPNTKDNITVNFYNPEENAGYYYLTFQLYLKNSDGTKDVLYESQLVEPGKYMPKINLAHGLEKGEYEAFVHVQPYRMDGTLTPTNNADLKMKIIVV